MFCNKCGSQNVEGAQFCQYCGTPFLPDEITVEMYVQSYKDTYLDCLRHKFFTFAGRASFNEYWRFQVADMVAMFLAILVMGALAAVGEQLVGVGAVLFGIWRLLMIFPQWAILVRRLHDTNRSGWHILWGVIPFFGWLYLFYCSFKSGDIQPNRYGMRTHFLQADAGPEMIREKEVRGSVLVAIVILMLLLAGHNFFFDTPKTIEEINPNIYQSLPAL